MLIEVSQSRRSTSSTQPRALVERLQAVSRQVVALTAAAVAESAQNSITLAQYRTLVVLAGTPDATAGEVASQLGVSPPAVTRLVRTLTRRRLVTRRVDSHDRRQVRLSLTSRGATLVASVARARERQFRRAIATLSSAQRSTLLESLGLLLDRLSMPMR
jgi:DNA-binding MarR family transcriptional regulator